MPSPDRIMQAYHHMTSGAKRLMPLLEKHHMYSTLDRMEVLLLKLRTIIPTLRDVDLLEETGCCCGEIRGARTNRPLCEACYERACGGGSL